MNRTCILTGFLVITWIMSLPSYGCIDGDNPPVGARAAGMANASVTFSGSWAAFSNQAGLAGIEKAGLGIHHENAFMVKEMALKAGMIAVPVHFGTLAMDASYFGYSRYNRTKIGLAYGRKLGKKIAAGIQLDYFSEYTADQRTRFNAFTFEGGVLVKLSEKVDLAAHLFNPANIGYPGRQGTSPEPEIRIGIGTRKIENFLLTFEAGKSLKGKPVYRVGAEYGIRKFLFLRTGLSTNPLLNTFGLGLNVRKVQIDMAFSRHVTLGYSPYFSLGYTF